MYKLDVTIQGLPKRINQGHGSHWKTRMGEARAWTSKLQSMIRFEIPTAPLQRAKVTIIRASSKCPDFDGLVYSGKVLLDGLRKLNVIIDDNMKVIGQPEYKWELAPKGKGFVRIIVEEIPQDQPSPSSP